MAANRDPVDNQPVVIDYLGRNPNFFLDNPNLPSKLNIPHINGRNIRSLIEYQIDHLRKNEQLLKTQIEILTNNQLQSERLTEEAYKLPFTLMNATSIESLYDALFLPEARI